MERPVLNQAMEDYLRTIFDVLENKEWATTSDIAKAMKISAPSVTAMIKRLKKLKLVIYKPYQGVKLSSVGRRMALEIVRHHRLLELYLYEALGVPWDLVHAEAEKLEHVLSEEIEERIANALGNPTCDPHGAPIPSKDGSIITVESRPLTAVESGETVTLVRVDDRVPEFLRFLAKHNLYPGTNLKVVEVEYQAGIVTLEVDNNKVALSQKAATDIYVTISAQ